MFGAQVGRHRVSRQPDTVEAKSWNQREKEHDEIAQSCIELLEEGDDVGCVGTLEQPRRSWMLRLKKMRQLLARAGFTTLF